MQDKVETVITVGKWASIISHVKSNRIEYLLVLGVAHLMGLTSKAYDQVSGVCI